MRCRGKQSILPTLAIFFSVLSIIITLEAVRWRIWKKVHPEGTVWQYIILEGRR